MSPRDALPSGPLLRAEDYAILAAVFFLPWAFGGVELWAFRSAALLLALGAAYALWRDGAAGLGLDAGARWLVPAFLLAGWAALQLVPLPPAALRLLSPQADAIYREAFPHYAGGAADDPVSALEARALELVPEARDVTLPDGPDGAIALAAPSCLSRSWRSLSLEPSATGERLAWYLALLAGYLVVRQRVSDRHRRTVYLGTLMGCALLLALFGIVQSQTWNEKLYWIRELRVPAVPFGPYVNANHFAGVMEMAVPTLIGYCWARLRRSGRAAVYEGLFGVAAVAAALCLAAGLAASSKVGALLLAASLLFLGFFGPRSPRVRAILGGALLVAIAAAAVLLVQTRLGERMTSFVATATGDDMLSSRGEVWLASTAMVADFPVFGSGFGSFREVFPRYTPAGASARFAQAHNDYLEVLLDGGLVAFGLMAWLAAGYGFQVRARLRQLSASQRILALGKLAGVGALAAHAVFDFNHQMPANALFFVVLCAILAPARRQAAVEDME